MSRRFLESFFPSLTSMHTNRTLYIYNMLLPKDVMEICPEIKANIETDTNLLYYMNNNSISIRNPALCIFAIIGAFLGLYVALFDPTFGMIQWYKSTSTSIHKKNIINFYWSISFLFFSLMNIAAIPLHCLLLVPINHPFNTLPQLYPYLWIMDTFCTGVFSSSLLVPLLLLSTTTKTNTTTNSYWYIILILCIGCIATIRFLVYNSSIELELWYALPLLFAVLLFNIQLFIYPHQNLSFYTDNSSQQQQKSTLLVYFYSIALVWLCVGFVIDPIACRYSIIQQHDTQIIISWWWDLTRLPAIAFGACDLAFIGLYHHLYTMTSSTPEKSKRY